MAYYNSIEKQMNLTDELLEKVNAICPDAFLAGGAALDWLFGHSANDLDIFLSLPDDSSQGTCEIILKALLNSYEYTPLRCSLNTTDPENFVINENYKMMDGLLYTFNTTINHQKVQFIILTQECLESGTSRFSTSICKVKYKQGIFSYHSDFKVSLLSGIAYLTEGYDWCDYHPNKVAKKIQSRRLPFKTGYKSEAVDYLIAGSFEIELQKLESKIPNTKAESITDFLLGPH